MADSFVSLNKMAELSGVPSTTVRRYLVAFKPFFPSQSHGRRIQYAPESVERVADIYDWYKQGLSTGEIYERLDSTVDAEIEITPAEGRSPEVDSTPMIIALLSRISDQHDRMQRLESEVSDLRKLIQDHVNKPGLFGRLRGGK